MKTTRRGPWLQATEFLLVVFLLGVIGFARNCGSMALTTQIRSMAEPLPSCTSGSNASSEPMIWDSTTGELNVCRDNAWVPLLSQPAIVYDRAGVISAGDSVTSTGNADHIDFSTLLHLPHRYLQTGYTVKLEFSGSYSTTAVDIESLSVSTRPIRKGTFLCGGDNFQIFPNNANSGKGPWQMTCQFTVGTTGASGKIYGPTFEDVWISDCDFGNCGGASGNNGGTPLYGGSFFPGHDSVELETTGYNESHPATLDTTSDLTLYLNDGFSGRAGATITWFQYQIEVIKPVG